MSLFRNSKDTNVFSAAAAEDMPYEDRSFVLFCMRSTDRGAPVPNIQIRIDDQEQMQRFVKAIKTIVKDEPLRKSLITEA